LFWKVRDDADEEYQVKKTSITRQFDAAELEPQAPAGTLSASLTGLLKYPAGTLSASLTGLLKGPEPAPTDKPAPKAKAEVDPDLVTLAALCKEYGIVGRIARRRLRSAFNQVGTGSRWEWKKDSADLVKVRTLLAPKPAPATPGELSVAAALETLGMSTEDLAAALASAGEQGAAAAAADEE
jgi:hypothetical protein